MDLDLFDCDATLGPRHRAPAGEPSTPGDLLSALDRCTIRRALVSHHAAWQAELHLGNRLLFELAAAPTAAGSAQRLFPCPTVAPGDADNQPSPDTFVAELLARGARAVRAMPRAMSWNLAEWCAGPLWRALETRRLPLFLPCSETSFDALHPMLAAHPDLPVILTDLSYRTERELYPFAAAHANLHLAMAPRYAAHDGIERLCARIGPARLLFGTRWPQSEPGAAITFLAYARLSDDDKQSIGAGNLDRLLREVRL